MQELPPIFATFQHSRYAGIVSIYDATPVPYYRYDDRISNAASSYSSYFMIAPHRFFQQDPTPTFLATDRPIHIPIAPVTLIAATHSHHGRSASNHRQELYRGASWLTGENIYCVYHPLPIPIVTWGDDDEHISLPTSADCQLEIIMADRAALRFWERRWTPEYIARDLHDEARPAAVVALRPTIKLPGPTVKLPTFVADLIVADAVAKGAMCPITMEPLTVETATVTPCYHVFDRQALRRWVTTATAGGPTVTTATAGGPTAAGGPTTPGVCPTCKSPLTGDM